MSARPRPVTATFIPADLQPCDLRPPVITPNRYSFSSGGSTESLISVLNHDSYESGCDSVDECNNKNNQTQTLTTSVQDIQLSRKTAGQRTKLRNAKNKPAERRSQTHTETSSDVNVGESHTWEDWVVLKAKEERRKVKENRRKRTEEEKLAKEKEEEEKVKKAKGEEKVREWLEKLDIREKTRKAMEKQNKRTKEELEEEKKREIQEKSEKKYQEWMTEKKEKLKATRRAEKEKQKKEDDEVQKKKEKSEAAYEEWKKKAAKRPKSAPNSFGYSCGKLTGYYDSAAYAVPSFYNPQPWQPVAIPKEKPKRKSRPASNYKWNPNKYL